MDPGLLPAGSMSAARHELARRALQIAAAPWPRRPVLPVVAVVAAVLGAWLANSMDWSIGDVRATVAVCAASLVATTAIAVGWASEPEELGQWTLRAVAAAVASALPILVS